MEDMLLEKDMDLVPIADTALAVLQMVDPVPASVSKLGWEAIFHAATVDLAL